MNLSILLFETVKVIISWLPVLIPLVAIIFLFFRPSDLLFLFLFFLGFMVFFVDVGLMVTIPKVFLISTIGSLMIYSFKDLKRAMSVYPAKEIFVVLVLFFAASALLNIPFFPVKSIVTAYGSLDDAIFRDRAGRQLFQIVMFVLKASIPIAIIAIGRSRAVIRKMFLVIIMGTTTLCLYGIYQLIAYKYNLPVMYIFRGAVNPDGAIGLFEASWGNVLRISSLAGEPKDLAAVLLPVLILLGTLAWFLPREENKKHITKKVVLWCLFILHLFILIFTYSTAGWLGALAAFGGVLFFILYRRPELKTVLIISGLVLGTFSAYFFVPSIGEVVHVRLFDKVNLEFFDEDTYGASQLLHMYKTRPQTIFIGASLGGAMFYEQYIEQPTSPIYYLFDYGVIGTLLLGIFFYQVSKQYLRMMEISGLKSDPLALSIFCAMIGSMVATFVFPKVDVVFILWTMVGLCGAMVLTVDKKVL